MRTLAQYRHAGTDGINLISKYSTTLVTNGTGWRLVCRAITDYAPPPAVLLTHNLNLLERLGKFTKRFSLDGRYHHAFCDFRAAIKQTLGDIPMQPAADLASLITLNFQTFESFIPIGGAKTMYPRTVA